MFFSLSCCNNIHVNGVLLNFVLGGLNSVDQIYIDKYSKHDFLATWKQGARVFSYFLNALDSSP